MRPWSLHRAPASGLLGTAMAIVSTSVACAPAIRADDADDLSNVVDEMRGLMRRTTVGVHAEDTDEPHVAE